MLKDNQKIVAIAWEAKKQDLSYGMFSAMLTEVRYIFIRSMKNILWQKRRRKKPESGSIPKARQKAMFQNRIF